MITKIHRFSLNLEATDDADILRAHQFNLAF